MRVAPDAARARRAVEVLSSEIGPRRPTSPAEAAAARWCEEDLRAAGVADVRFVPFDGISSFGPPQSVPIALALAASLLSRRLPRLSALTGASAVAIGAVEEGLRISPVSRVLNRSRSQNVVARINAAGTPRRTVCLVGHLDSSRSGLLFHPGFVAHLRTALNVVSVAAASTPAHPLLRRFRAGRIVIGASRLALAAGLGLLVERELRGVDVPGANDNASGTAVVLAIAAALAAEPLERTDVAILLTGCEESGLHGSRAFLDANDTTGWIFLNFDGVGARAGLRWLPREGMSRKWASDPRLVALAATIAAERPELELSESQHDAGLTYDATPVLARGGRALTFTAHDRTIPEYHSPTDTLERLSEDGLERTLELAGEMLRRIDRGEAD